MPSYALARWQSRVLREVGPSFQLIASSQVLIEGCGYHHRCDGGPVSAPPPPAAHPPAPSTSSQRAASSASSAATDADDERAIASRSRASTPLTPPLPEHGNLDEDEDDDEHALEPVADAQTLARRREQSELASKRIGELLLKGWAMLDAQCDSDGCWGVPLMRSPKGTATQRTEEPKKGKFCVICQTNWDAPRPSPSDASRGPVSAVNALRSASTEDAIKAGVYDTTAVAAKDDAVSPSIARRKRTATEISHSASSSTAGPSKLKNAKVRRTPLTSLRATADLVVADLLVPRPADSEFGASRGAA